MRHFGLVLLLAGAAGCSSNQMYFEQRSELESRTTSLVLYDDGVLGQGSMNEATCMFDTRNGMLVNDVDLPTTDERIEDVRGSVVVARSAEGIHVLDENGWDEANDISLPGVMHVRMLEDGIASLVSDEVGCRVDWRNDDAITTTGLDAAVCESAKAFTVDRVTGQTWIALGDDVVSVTQDGSQSLGLAGDLLARDAISGNLFVATRGGAVVTALDAQGDIQWTRSSNGGTVHAVSGFGALGAAAVVVGTNAGADIRVFDGVDGEQLADYGMPDVAEVVVSEDSSTVALVTPDRVFFYDVFEGSQPIVFNDVETVPPAMFAD